MKQEDKILAEIQRLKKELKDYSATEALDYIESYVNLIAREQSSLSSNLDEAAEEYGKKQGIEDKPYAIRHFKAGAKWMAEQAEKDVIAMAKKYLEMGHRCMEQSQEHRDESSYTIFWDGFHNCAENILRELENKE